MQKWYDRSWNPLYGCSAKFRGCENCRAIDNLRRQGRGTWPQVNRRVLGYALGGGMVYCVCSLGDFFSPGFSDRQRLAVLRKMWSSPDNIYVIQTRHSGEMANFMKEHSAAVPPSTWLGVSVEDQCSADSRLPDLKGIWPKTFVSVSPLLEEVELAPHLLEGIGWLTVGCETGEGRRPCDPRWVKKVVDSALGLSIPVWVEAVEEDGKVIEKEESLPAELRYRQTPFKRCSLAGRHFIGQASCYIEPVEPIFGESFKNAFVISAPLSVFHRFFSLVNPFAVAVKMLGVWIPAEGDGSYTPESELGRSVWKLFDICWGLKNAGMAERAAYLVLPDGLRVRFRLEFKAAGSLPSCAEDGLFREYVESLRKMTRGAD